MSIDHDRFRRLLGHDLDSLTQAGIARPVAKDLAWGEGPVWFAAAAAWIFSDIPNNRMLAWSERDGLTVFRSPSEFANGNTLAADGAVLTCEHGTRRISRTAPDGAYRVVCDAYAGKRLNSPNDLVEHRDGSIWFSDPTYGIVSDVEGYRADSEQGANRVYRCDPATGVATAQVDSLKMPNGLCFTPDGRTLYVADSGADMGPDIAFDPQGPREVQAFAIGPDGNVAGPGRFFARATRGVPDGLRCDAQGYLWMATGLGAECFDADGRRVGAVATPETLANLAFGGPDGDQMLLALANSAYLLTVPAGAGAA
jgi:gluconolactonase